MKIGLNQSNRADGSVLCATLVVCTLLGVLVGSYLCLLQTERASVSRSQCWSSALEVAEAGVEEAMSQLNSGVSTNNLATNTWVSLASGVVGKTNFLGSSYYSVSIQTPPAISGSPVILSTSYVPGPISGPSLSRTIRVVTKAQTAGGGSAAIKVSGTVDLSGSKVTVDSFDSSNTNYSTGGQYDPNKRLANGDIYTMSSATNAISIGDSSVYGTIHTPPGGVVGVDTGNHPTDSVGDAAWVSAGTVGIETGHAAQDSNFTSPDVTLPNNLIWMTPASTKYKTNSVNFGYVLDNSSPWKLSNLSAAVYVSSPNVVLYVTDTLSLGTGTEIYLAPGASLTLYCGAASASIGGQGVVNSSGYASNFKFEGLPACTSFGLQANASFTGQIYAPEAFVSIGGGGSSTYDFSGQITAASMKLNGHFNLHYDQALALNSGLTFAGYTAASWKEL